jgi:protein-L-isoaspartate(D-aspartate) O-methyltransferase
MPDWNKQRAAMVREQLVKRGITDSGVLKAMAAVPRHAFIPPLLRAQAYHDGPLPVGIGQTISQPYVVALMTELLALTGKERILEIGTGSGYQAAILGKLAQEVISLERHKKLADRARKQLSKIGIVNVRVLHADGSEGDPTHAPYDAILVAAAAPKTPRILLRQLANGGRLVIPVGGRGHQRIERWLRRDNDFQRERLSAVSFVPMRGDAGWSEKDWE